MSKSINKHQWEHSRSSHEGQAMTWPRSFARVFWIISTSFLSLRLGLSLLARGSSLLQDFCVTSLCELQSDLLVPTADEWFVSCAVSASEVIYKWWIVTLHCGSWRLLMMSLADVLSFLLHSFHDESQIILSVKKKKKNCSYVPILSTGDCIYYIICFKYKYISF